jgi:hypothetical protein
MGRATRILAVLAGLILTGAVIGALVGAAAMAIGTAIMGPGPVAADDAVALYVGTLVRGGTLGAAIGAVAAPLAGFLLLRSVPLGRAVGWTTLGAAVGGVTGTFLRPAGFPAPMPVVAAALGFLLVALVLRLRAPARSSASRPAEPVE